jgi:hypothetical protein
MKKFSLLLVVVLLPLVGCKINPGKTSEPVEITGRVTQNGNPVNNVTLNLQPTGKGTQAALPVKNGEIRGSVTPGKYTYYVTESGNPAALKSIPEKYHLGSLDRQVEISSGSTLTITLD